ncbi:unnamed protein product, partial [Meganyctiphanes norvegica]
MGSASSLKYPRGAFFILGGYLTERFVYYGLFGGFVLYAQRMLGFTASSASSTKAIAEGLIYLCPILGSIIADSFFGKVRMVFTMCCIYTVGAAIMALSAVTPMWGGIDGASVPGVGGMLVLGIAAGLMKAVYTSLGGDQFKIPEQRDLQKRYFYAFYWMINAGAYLGQTMTSNLRISVQCFGGDCFFLPFCILVGFMVLSTIIFFFGRSYYVAAAPDPTLINSIKCVGYSIKKFFQNLRGSERKPVEHFMDRSVGKYDQQLVSDVKDTLRVLLLFCTFPLFWALFYQTSTGMIFQAKRLNGYMSETYRIPPEMSGTLNPLFIITLIPLFDLVIYPLFNKWGILTQTPHRMVTGMIFAVTAFVAYGLVNVGVEQAFISSDMARIHVYNARSCDISINLPTQELYVVSKHGQLLLPDIKIGDESTVSISIPNGCDGAPVSDITISVSVLGGKESTLLITPNGAVALPPTDEYLKDEGAEAKIRVLMIKQGNEKVVLIDNTLEVEFNVTDPVFAKFKPVSPENYNVTISDKNLGQVFVTQDGVYDVVVLDNEALLFPMTAPSDLHMAVLIPQYLLLTIGEILFSVSSMDFAYSEAPGCMKSLLQAANLFTITVGLWLFAILSKISEATGVFDHRPSSQAFSYAFLMALNTVVFVLLLKRYLSQTDEKEKTEAKEMQSSDNTGQENQAYVEDQA